MQFWWLNESKTWAQAVRLGAAWAPLIDSAGHKQPHWERMTEIHKNDVVVHYVSGQIRAISRVLAPAQEAANPYDGDSWHDQGREIKLTYEELLLAIALDAIPQSLRNIGEPASPFNKEGGVNQGYFFRLHDDLASWIFSEAGLLDTGSDDLNDPESEPAGRRRTVITRRPDGTKEVKTRGEHKQLVKHLFRGKTHRECDLCGRTFPVKLLVTAHIKQRAKASPAQRIDSHIVMAACSLGCD